MKTGLLATSQTAKRGWTLCGHSLLTTSTNPTPDRRDYDWLLSPGVSLTAR
jgi:hypothetical protein